MITTHALFARKVQRKLRNGVAGFAAGGSSLDQRVREGAGCWPPGPSCVSPAPQLKREMLSVARIRPDSRKSVRAFKGIICDDISEFESSHASHAVCVSLLVVPENSIRADSRVEALPAAINVGTLSYGSSAIRSRLESTSRASARAKRTGLTSSGSK